jgi:hypothetical protein
MEYFVRKKESKKERNNDKKFFVMVDLGASQDI